MTLNNYKIIDDGIWISKKELEQMRDAYCSTADHHKRNWVNDEDKFRYPYYIGKCDICNDILKHFDNASEENIKTEEADK